MDWESVDWTALQRLREVFLRRAENPGPYWESAYDLASYDFTFGRRIAWKWAAVMDEMAGLNWTPPAPVLVDWGCGTGIGARSFLAHLGSSTLDEIVLWDHSVAATSFAREAIRARGHEVAITVGDPSARHFENGFILVVSHVLNELDATGRAALIALAAQAAAVIWVEPGTHADSRTLIEAREALREQFHCWLPCPHSHVCGLLAAGNEHHWCHHFARPPTEAFTEQGWGVFGRRMGIDLRSTPYSYVVLDRREAPRLAHGKRILGQPREGNGVMEVLRCQDPDVSEVQLQKRDSTRLWKTLARKRHTGLHQWQEDAHGRISGDTEEQAPHPPPAD